jgi:hypothetical protein
MAFTGAGLMLVESERREQVSAEPVTASAISRRAHACAGGKVPMRSGCHLDAAQREGSIAHRGRRVVDNADRHTPLQWYRHRRRRLPDAD